MSHTRTLVVGSGLTVMIVALAAATHVQTRQAPIFEVDPMWPKPMPNHWILGSAVGVAVDAKDHVFVLNLPNSFNARTEIGAATTPPTGECCVPAPNVLEFDPAGNLVAHWGGGADWPLANHGLAIDDKGSIWMGGSGGIDTRMFKFGHDGTLAMQIGKAVTPPPAPAPDPAAAAGAGRGRGRGRASGPPPIPANSASMESFGGAADVAFDPATNEAFVADGYRNHRIAVIDMNTGAIKRMWGAYGNPPDDAAAAPYDPGGPPSKQFATVRCVGLSRDGFVYVCDRGNDRIQVFKKDGSFVKEKAIAPTTRGDGSVWDIAFSPDPQQRFLYVADGMNMKVYILDRQSLEVLSSFGDGGRQPGQFYAVHSLATDSKGNLYTTETYEGKRVQKFTYKGLGAASARGLGVPWPKP